MDESFLVGGSSKNEEETRGEGLPGVMDDVENREDGPLTEDE